MLFNTLIASTIVAFASAAPAAQVDWTKVDYSGVDYSGIDWNAVDYSQVDWSKIPWDKVNYGAMSSAAPAPAPSATTLVSVPSASPSAAPVANAFNFISTRSGDINVHLRPLYAKNSAIRIGGTAPTSQTPNIPVLAGFPTTTTTTFFVNNGQADLDVSVPGGQQIYVSSTGQLQYTVPHSGNTGTGSTRTGFSVTGSGSNFNLKFDDKAGFVACPAQSSGASAGEYDIFVADKTTRTDCTGISVLGTANINPPKAWQW